MDDAREPSGSAGPWPPPSASPREPGGEPGGGSILVVDDDPFISRLLQIELEASGFEVRTAPDGPRALALAQERCPDLVLADVMMPEMDGFELTRRLRQDPRTAGVPVIMLTARGMSADKLEGFSAGADDYIVKPFDTPELLARIRGVIRRSREMRAQSPLTGLPGNVRIEEEIQRRVREGEGFAVLYADLDHFKAYNDHYGFMRGDEVIRATGRLLQEVVSDLVADGGFVGHVGGDDFVLLVPPGDAERVAEAIVERFDRLAPSLYDAPDRTRGFIEVADRRGEVQRFPLLAISIGVASTARRRFAHFAHVVAVATEMKRYTKRASEGSSWAMDRRRT
ncbi:MAG TPA: response regulator [Actinomycetota bacterium]|nr:response regulator [Actinomycetota bacterium]